MNKFPCLNCECNAPIACGGFGFCRLRNTHEPTYLENLLADALAGMFALHEAEGRFQPIHYKSVLAKACKALAVASGKTEVQITQELAQRWRDMQNEYVRPKP